MHTGHHYTCSSYSTSQPLSYPDTIRMSRGGASIPTISNVSVDFYASMLYANGIWGLSDDNIHRRMICVGRISGNQSLKGL